MGGGHFGLSFFFLPVLVIGQEVSFIFLDLATEAPLCCWAVTKYIALYQLPRWLQAFPKVALWRLAKRAGRDLH